ncbi:MAG: glycosyltransferase [Alphaproteobacteria bacterium]|nr:glycosyltransferase [Alphaproteobacteria bacterium]
MTAARLGIAWPLSTVHGWGVLGANLALALVRRRGPRPVLLEPPRMLALDPLRRLALAPFLAEAETLAQRLKQHPGFVVAAEYPVLHALGNGLQGGRIHARRGRPDIGMVFLEDTAIDAAAAERAARYGRLVAGSSWLGALLRDAGLAGTATVLQGVDATLFHPGPRARPLGERFLVFSGGKLEDRKGQDLVVAAFRRFRERRRDAVLVTAWQNPLPQFAEGIVAGGLVAAPPERRADGSLEVGRWLAGQGLPEDAFVDLGMIPNPRMPVILREMDAALFPNRCEGGTNLVAMECLAAGVPTILSANTGHLDLLAGPDVAIALGRQRPVARPGVGTDGWGESDVEEIVAALETIGDDPTAAAARAGRAARWMAAEWSWDRRAAELVAAVG